MPSRSPSLSPLPAATSGSLLVHSLPWVTCPSRPRHLGPFSALRPVLPTRGGKRSEFPLPTRLRGAAGCGPLPAATASETWLLTSSPLQGRCPVRSWERLALRAQGWESCQPVLVPRGFSALCWLPYPCPCPGWNPFIQLFSIVPANALCFLMRQ